MKYLLITGSYRSGTTFLLKAFQANNRFCMLFQPYFDFFKYFDSNIRVLLKKKKFKNFPLGLTKINKKLKLDKIILQKSKILKVLGYLIKKKDINYNYYKVIQKKILIKSEKVNYQDLMDIMFSSLTKNNYNKKFYGFKECYIGDQLKLLHKIKNLYIINIIRDPREIFFSRNYSKVKNHFNFKNKKHPVIMNSLLCNQNMSTDLNLKKKPRYLSINFNDLIYNRRSVENKIYRFLNTKISLNINKIKKITKWNINSSGAKPNYGSNWLENINKDELSVIEKICGNNMSKYGFKLIYKNKKKISIDLKKFRENKDKILKWTRLPIFIKYSKTEVLKF
tara:strand:- start:14513 stop:15523 length:1011 start_codon:yes stop_codon:yes gene_type:complete